MQVLLPPTHPTIFLDDNFVKANGPESFVRPHRDEEEIGNKVFVSFRVANSQWVPTSEAFHMIAGPEKISCGVVKVPLENGVVSVSSTHGFHGTNRFPSSENPSAVLIRIGIGFTVMDLDFNNLKSETTTIPNAPTVVDDVTALKLLQAFSHPAEMISVSPTTSVKSDSESGATFCQLAGKERSRHSEKAKNKTFNSYNFEARCIIKGETIKFPDVLFMEYEEHGKTILICQYRPWNSPLGGIGKANAMFEFDCENFSDLSVQKFKELKATKSVRLPMPPRSIKKGTEVTRTTRIDSHLINFKFFFICRGDSSTH
jgi:hypothetical protein